MRVEQTETHAMMLERVANEKEKGKPKAQETVVGREIAGKYTKGTFLKPLPIEDFLNGKQDEDEELDTKYVLLYLYDQDENIFGVAFFDTNN